MAGIKIAIIGGGAAGLAAAISAKRTNPSAEVRVFERNDRVGRKLLSTGNGRCNLSNTDISAENYASHSLAFVGEVLSGRDFGFVSGFFASLGIPLALEDGRAYPRSMRAGSVADALRFECERRGVDLRLNAKITAVTADKGRFVLDGERFDRLIIAAGGMAAPSLGTDGLGFELARSLGHRTLAPYPALVQLRTVNPDKALKGIRAEARVSAILRGECIRREEGEVQFTDYGLSGIPVLTISAFFAPGMSVSLDLLPELSFSEAMEALLSLTDSAGELALPELCGGYFHKNITRSLCARAGIDALRPSGTLTSRELKGFISEAKNMSFPVAGTNSWTNAQTTRGGVDLREIDSASMRSKLHGGLYFAGEITDVCGACGGYNLHWAWITGIIAGESAAK